MVDGLLSLDSYCHAWAGVQTPVRSDKSQDYVRNFGPETCNVALLYMSTDEDDDLMYCTCRKYC